MAVVTARTLVATGTCELQPGGHVAATLPGELHPDAILALRVELAFFDHFGPLRTRLADMSCRMQGGVEVVAVLGDGDGLIGELLGRDKFGSLIEFRLFLRLGIHLYHDILRRATLDGDDVAQLVVLIFDVEVDADGILCGLCLAC